jgi:aminodeoxyfutalosine synthase
MVTPAISQIALDFGCDDVEGTVVHERVYHDAGADTPLMLSYGDLVRLIHRAGKEPTERNSLYETVRTFALDDPLLIDPGWDSAGSPARPDPVRLTQAGPS